MSGAHALASLADRLVCRSQSPHFLILINDEVHSFDDVIDRLDQAIGADEAQARLFANVIDRDGRAVVWSGTKEDCQARGQVLGSTGLQYLVLDARTLQLQESSVNMLAWCVSISQQSQGLRRLMAAGLFSKQGDGLSILDKYAPQYYKLWKKPRALLKEVVLSCLWVEQDYKIQLGEWFIEVGLHCTALWLGSGLHVIALSRDSSRSCTRHTESL